MSRALLYHERQSDGGWKPCGVFLATQKNLDVKVLPGSAGRTAWATGFAKGQPPFKDGIGLSLERGTWEDWCDYALESLSNGHDTWITEVEPEPMSASASSLEATYNRYVLGATSTAPAAVPAVTDEPPTLSGYKKVRPN